MQPISIERTIWIDAPRQRVWNAITDPAQVERWWSPGISWISTGSQVGGKLYTLNPETGAEMYVQIVELVDPPHRLVTRSQPEPPAKSETTSYKLDEENGGTRLTLIYSGYEHVSDEKVRKDRMDQEGTGFGMVMENIKAHIEETPLPYPQGF